VGWSHKRQWPRAGNPARAVTVTIAKARKSRFAPTIRHAKRPDA
jgi:hypothetical protein